MLKILSEGNHALIHIGPEVYVQLVEACDLGIGKYGAAVGGYRVPVTRGIERVAVVVVAVGPVRVVEALLGQSGEGQHICPRGGIFRVGKDLAEIEENGPDGMNRVHGSGSAHLCPLYRLPVKPSRS